MPTTARKNALPRHVEDAVKHIATLQRTHHAEAKPSERITDRAVAIIGTPTFFGVLLFLATAWMIVNKILGTRSLDTPPYPILEMVCSLVGVLLAVLILAAQRRDDRLDARREQMTLQVCLLVEQKVSKLIELSEELRRDMPNVDNRIDLDAIEMTAPVDHGTALKTVEKASVPPDDVTSDSKR